MVDTIALTADRVLQCVSQALEEDLRPVCKVYQTVGTPVILTCCECDDDGSNGEVSIHVTRLFDADSSSLDEVVRVRPCRAGTTVAQFRLVVARCLPTIDEHGEIPEPEVIEDKAIDLARDMELVWQALACCYEGRLRIDDITVDLGPLGGCSVFYADLSIPVQIPPPGAVSG